jgi:hypothetical protein
MPRKQIPDETLSHEAVKLYRDTFRMCPKAGFRRDIISTVEDLELWKSILTTWGYSKDGKWIKFSPLNVKGMLSEYERRARTNTELREPSRSAEGVQVGVPRRGDGDLLPLRKDSGVFSRSGGESLEEILTFALRSQNRS